MRRSAYTLIELLVAMALIMMIMSILSQAYIKGMDTFSKLKGIGDMSEKLRTAAVILRRDLAADHFNGAARISDPNFTTNPNINEGFFRVSNPGSQMEPPGPDAHGIPSWMSTNFTVLPLHFSIKLRGNRQQDFIQGNIPNPTFFNQPPDGSYGVGYQWAEVAYYLQPIADPIGNQEVTSPGTSGGPLPLFALYRAQNPVPSASGGYSPSSIFYPGGRAIQGPGGGALLLSDVLNFDVQAMPTTAPNGAPNFSFTGGTFDSGQIGMWPTGLRAVQISIRVYDLKSRQARQITVVQDL